MLCIQTVEIVFFDIWSITQPYCRLSTKDINDQIDIKSCDYHVTNMAAEERAFKKTVRLIIPPGL